MTTRTITANEQTIIAQQLQAWSAPRLSLLSNTPIIYSIKSPLKSTILSAFTFVFMFGIYLSFLNKDKFDKKAIINTILLPIVFLVIICFLIYLTTNWKNNRIINALPYLPENATVSQYNSYIGWF